jgi:phosphonatase-like hydrolase
MSNTIKMVVLDMAGTTINEDNIVYKTLHKAVEAQGIEVDLSTVLKICAGKEKHKAIIDLLKNLGIENVDSKVVFENFKKNLEEAYDLYEIKPIDGVEAFFSELKNRGVIVVLNTGYDSKTANKLLSKLNWSVGNQIDALITADDVVTGRPSAEMINLAMEIFSISNSKNVLKAGDSAIDIEEGKSANCGLTVGVLSGAQSKEELAKASPNYIFQNVTQIIKLFV